MLLQHYRLKLLSDNIDYMFEDSNSGFSSLLHDCYIFLWYFERPFLNHIDLWCSQILEIGSVLPYPYKKLLTITRFYSKMQWWNMRKVIMNLLSSPVLNLGWLQRMLINASQCRFNRRFSELHRYGVAGEKLIQWCSRFLLSVLRGRLSWLQSLK